MNDYGKELVVDLWNCDVEKFTRKSIRNYFKNLCDLIDMEREKLTWWDDLYTPKEEKETHPKLVGTSAVQFIRTSNITIHTLDKLKKAYINIFSCKEFNEMEAMYFTEKWFGGSATHYEIINRR